METAAQSLQGIDQTYWVPWLQENLLSHAAWTLVKNQRKSSAEMPRDFDEVDPMTWWPATKQLLERAYMVTAHQDHILVRQHFKGLNINRFKSAEHPSQALYPEIKQNSNRGGVFHVSPIEEVFFFTEAIPGLQVTLNAHGEPYAAVDKLLSEKSALIDQFVKGSTSDSGIPIRTTVPKSKPAQAAAPTPAAKKPKPQSAAPNFRQCLWPAH